MYTLFRVYLFTYKVHLLFYKGQLFYYKLHLFLHYPWLLFHYTGYLEILYRALISSCGLPVLLCNLPNLLSPD